MTMTARCGWADEPHYTEAEGQKHNTRLQVNRKDYERPKSESTKGKKWRLQAIVRKSRKSCYSKIELFEGELTGYIRQIDLILIFSNRPCVAKCIFFFDFEEEAGPVQVFWWQHRNLLNDSRYVLESSVEL